ncbi:serine/threonine protein kinase [Actinoplanes sp. KI2]|uniref:serine/threonine-protein kinase n=1 Tax=Actinoplanes sp. KI2 TaxID=2983315 RepID=UPI0021D56A18|nr:serine/threonine-protein kinase [Actinoplanes sp. KI2]MCU7728445.1 serine/threonine protein kinase [Actinoplanes sp. KI2]
MATRPLRPGDPRRLGDYRLLSLLGEGGMGTVFLGRDPAGRPVAVKAIRPEYAADREFRARFRSEVHRAQQVPSFCTAAVLDADPDGDTPYLVVEYVEGPSLQDVVEERGPMAPGDLHSVAVGVAAALTAIHGAGVIHRDLKPSNVLLALGLPKVIDFGIARALEATTKHTRTGRWVGTVDFMAPERLDPDFGPVTPAADIFAWGGVIVYAGTGRNPFLGDTPVATAAQILTKAPELRGVPDALVDLVRRAFAKDPGDRPSANEVLQQLLATNVAHGGLPGGSLAGWSAEGKARRSGGRFDARDLLGQVIAEGPKPPPAARAAATPARGAAAKPARGAAAKPARGAAAKPARGAAAKPARGAAAKPAHGQAASAAAAAQGNSRAGRRRAAAKARGTTRRLTYAIGAVLVASVAAATVAYARTTGDPPSQKTEPQTKAASAALTPAQRGPSFFDPLSAPGRFRASVAASGSCTFRDGELKAQVKGRSTFQCPGPDDTFAGNQSISVRVELTDPAACAMVWFRYRGDRGYQLTACAGQVELEELDGVLLTSLGKTSSTTLQPGGPHQLAIVIADQHADVTIDGKDALQGAVTNPSLAGGRIQLGVTNTSAAATAEVSFANLDARAG